MSNSKIVVDADHGKLDAASKKSAAEMKKIANAAKDITTHFDTLGKQIVNRVAGLTAMVAVIRSVGDQMAARQGTTADANRTRGARTVGMGRDLRSLGLDQGPGGAAGAFDEMGKLTGNRSQDELAQFLSQLAAKQQGAKRKATPDTIREVLSLFSTGLFDDSELSGAVDDPRARAKLFGQVTKRQDSLTPQEQAERRIRYDENRSSEFVERTNAASGYRRRGAQADMARAGADNVVGAGIFGVVRDAANVVGAGGIVDATANALMQTTNATLAKIAENTKPSAKPSMQPTTESGP